MKKQTLTIILVVGILILMGGSFVVGQILTTQDFMAKYADNSLIKTHMLCEGDNQCMKKYLVMRMCITIDETVYNGRNVTYMACDS